MQFGELRQALRWKQLDFLVLLVYFKLHALETTRCLKKLCKIVSVTSLSNVYQL